MSAYLQSRGITNTVNSEILARVYFRETSHMRSFVKKNPRKIANSFCHLPIKENHALKSRNFSVANMSF